MEIKQKKFLAAKFKAAVAVQPQIRKLRKRLLQLGGVELVCQPYEEELERILERGRDIDGIFARKTWQMPNQCHRNSADLYWLWKRGRFERRCKQIGIMTGYALSGDGLWRQHSWLVNGFNRVLETTDLREKYFGYTMNQEEIEEFISWQT